MFKIIITFIITTIFFILVLPLTLILLLQTKVNLKEALKIVKDVYFEKF
jgi:uncharacterized membrane protein YbhN (UPF0104 family)